MDKMNQIYLDNDNFCQTLAIAKEMIKRGVISSFDQLINQEVSIVFSNNTILTREGIIVNFSLIIQSKEGVKSTEYALFCKEIMTDKGIKKEYLIKLV